MKNAAAKDKQYSLEALRALKTFAEPGAYAMPAENRDADERVLLVYSARNGFQNPIASIRSDVARQLQQRDLIGTADDPRKLVISSAGLGALRRALARNEPFLAQHQSRVLKTVEDGESKRKAIVNEAESPLAWLRGRLDKDRKPMIDDAQFRAGERLRADFTRAQMEPRVTAKWDAVASSRRERRGSANDAQMLSDTALAARQRVERALQAVGPDFASILLDVCCFLKGMEETEKQNGLPQRSGKIVLKLALNALARHYGMIAPEPVSLAMRPRIQHWGSGDYRPSIEADVSRADAHA